MRHDISYYFEDISDVFCFGKHKNKPLWSVIAEDEDYIYWCINNIPSFRLSENTLKQIRDLFPDFIIASNFSCNIDNQQPSEDYYYDDYDWYNEENDSTYESYNGYYAQDEMGYSDDEIDTIFDGEPDAYWNID